VYREVREWSPLFPLSVEEVAPAYVYPCFRVNENFFKKKKKKKIDIYVYVIFID
jgi:hypothetical protein